MEHTIVLIKGMALICAGLISLALGLCMLIAGTNAIWLLARGDFHRLIR